jgi:hypothetical protein
MISRVSGRMTILRTALLVTLLGTSVAVASPTTYSVRLRLTAADGTSRLVPIGEVSRDHGNVTYRQVAAPAVDKLTDDLVAAWKAYKRPARVKVTENIASDTGMKPSWDDHTFEFTSRDALYPAAVVKDFIEKHGYEGLGLSTIRFVEFDSTEESPRGADDASSRRFNFRKGTTLDTSGGGYESVFVQRRVHPESSGTPMYVLRTSASQPALAVAQNNDDGLVELGHFKLYPDGRIVLEPIYLGKEVEERFARFADQQDIEVSLIKDAKDWTKRTVKRTSPWFLEAYLVDLEQREFYDISPPIDPALLK